MARRTMLWAWLVAAGCGGASEAPAGKPDLSAPAQDAAVPGQSFPGGEAPGDGMPCVTDQDCPPNDIYTGTNRPYNMRLCEYPIADGCAAVGHCFTVHAPFCGSIAELCGCDGTIVRSGCFYLPGGYASGPTTGASALTCRDGGS